MTQQEQEYSQAISYDPRIICVGLDSAILKLSLYDLGIFYNYNATITHLQTQLMQQHDEWNKKYESTFNAQNETINVMRESSTEQEELIKKLEQENEIKQTKINLMQEQIDNFNETIKQLEKQLQEKSVGEQKYLNTIKQQAETFAACSKELVAVQSSMELHETKYKECVEQIKVRKDMMHKLETTLAIRNKKISELETSNALLQSKLKEHASATAVVVAAGGGVAPTNKKQKVKESTELKNVSILDLSETNQMKKEFHFVFGGNDITTSEFVTLPNPTNSTKPITLIDFSKAPIPIQTEKAHIVATDIALLKGLIFKWLQKSIAVEKSMQEYKTNRQEELNNWKIKFNDYLIQQKLALKSKKSSPELVKSIVDATQSANYLLEIDFLRRDVIHNEAIWSAKYNRLLHLLNVFLYSLPEVMGVEAGTTLEAAKQDLKCLVEDTIIDNKSIVEADRLLNGMKKPQLETAPFFVFSEHNLK